VDLLDAARSGDSSSPGGPLDLAVYDATGLSTVAALDGLRSFFAPGLSRLRPGGRLLLLARAPDTLAEPEAAAAAQACEGFIRSLAKEVGRRGATANLLWLEPGAEAGLAAPLAFFGGPRSAYVSGRTLRLAAAPISAGQGLGGRIAVVTGAARGLGAATAERLAAEGARVLCVDVPAAGEPLEALARRLGGQALALDITAADAGVRLVTALQAAGGVDVVVHNAGITRDRTLARMSEAEWGAVLAVNLRAVLGLDAALDAAGLWRPGAREVCLSSISGIAGNSGQTNYAASKAALLGYVAARARLAPAPGMTVNAVAPGFIETEMTARIPWLIREAGRRMNALSQGGQPQDVAEAIAFLAQPGAAGVNGQVLRVCGQALLGA
jgi:3-oxoacyl-[acyl-carrier protein] reductase